MAHARNGNAHLPPVLDSTAQQPPLFDGTTRLYTSYSCPYAQRVWITRNCKGLEEEIKLVPLNMRDRPSWYKDKVYPINKVPSLEHNGRVMGESLDLIKYLDTNFEGPPLYTDDPARKEFGEEMMSYTNEFNMAVYVSFTKDTPNEVGPLFDYLENAQHKFEDGPFFLGHFSLVDIAYIPFVERFQIFLSEARKYDITEGRPKLATWIELETFVLGRKCIVEMNKMDAYRQTKCDPEELVRFYKTHF